MGCLEDGRVGRNPCESKVVDHVIGEETSLILGPLVQSGLSFLVRSQDAIEALITLNSENVGKESMVAQVFSNVGIVNDGRNIQRLEISTVSDARQ